VTNKYLKEIKPGVDVDVYDILLAFGVSCPATQHAIKKLLMPGQRGSKDTLLDLKEARSSIDRAMELEARSAKEPEIHFTDELDK